jgi:thiamine kinase-like enzyme
MLEGLDHLLQNSGQPGLPELRELLEELLGGSHGSGRLTEEQTLQPRGQRVFRLRFTVNGHARSVVIKRLKPEIARRNELVAQRWLPAIGLAETGPPLLGSVAARNGACVWHVYDDLGSWELNNREPDRERVQAAIDLIVKVHTRFAGHALLGEVRLQGGDLGIHFYETNVRDAISALHAWRPPAELAALRDGLLDRLYELRDDARRRAEAVADWAGPETLLHGDLWAINVFVMPASAARASGPSADELQPSRGWTARLIDWDHAAVGPASYDLSTFLLRFPARHRSWVFALYEQALLRVGWKLPAADRLNLLFETHEYARFANRIIWPAIALVMDGAEWGIAELAEITQWFEQFQPVLRASPAPGGSCHYHCQNHQFMPEEHVLRPHPASNLQRGGTDEARPSAPEDEIGHAAASAAGSGGDSSPMAKPVGPLNQRPGEEACGPAADRFEAADA